MSEQNPHNPAEDQAAIQAAQAAHVAVSEAPQHPEGLTPDHMAEAVQQRTDYVATVDARRDLVGMTDNDPRTFKQASKEKTNAYMEGIFEHPLKGSVKAYTFIGRALLSKHNSKKAHKAAKLHYKENAGEYQTTALQMNEAFDQAVAPQADNSEQPPSETTADVSPMPTKRVYADMSGAINIVPVHDAAAFVAQSHALNGVDEQILAERE